MGFPSIWWTVFTIFNFFFLFVFFLRLSRFFWPFDKSGNLLIQQYLLIRFNSAPGIVLTTYLRANFYHWVHLFNVLFFVFFISYFQFKFTSEIVNNMIHRLIHNTLCGTMSLYVATDVRFFLHSIICVPVLALVSYFFHLLFFVTLFRYYLAPMPEQSVIVR